ncbi:MAG TPA: type II toxin-antitoxin system RelE/ParE family toxin [Thermoanaerobaculia bacterium]
MKRSIELTHLAERQLAAAGAWWRRNRDKAPDAFDEEMQSALLYLSENLASSTSYRHARRSDVRRYLIERIRYHIYFRVVGDTIQVLRIWHASRRPPRGL